MTMMQVMMLNKPGIHLWLSFEKESKFLYISSLSLKVHKRQLLHPKMEKEMKEKFYIIIKNQQQIPSPDFKSLFTFPVNDLIHAHLLSLSYRSCSVVKLVHTETLFPHLIT
jgi:hypothetical protein